MPMRRGDSFLQFLVRCILGPPFCVGIHRVIVDNEWRGPALDKCLSVSRFFSPNFSYRLWYKLYTTDQKTCV